MSVPHVDASHRRLLTVRYFTPYNEASRLNRYVVYSTICQAHTVATGSHKILYALSAQIQLLYIRRKYRRKPSRGFKPVKK